MKQVKTVLTVISLLIGICIPQSTNAQQQDQLPINLVGKWINKYSDYVTREYFADSTMTMKNNKTVEVVIKGTDIKYPIKTRIWQFTWKIDGNILTLIELPKYDFILGDISFYPADIQKKIKEDRERAIKGKTLETLRMTISSFSPEVMKLSQGEDWWEWVRDVSNMSAQEKNEYNKEIEKWNKIKKEKEQKEYLAALERDNLQMAKKKAEAVASGDQRDYWVIGHMYEYGEGDGMTTTICLDSALVWYKKAAAIDPINERYVTALTHKIKTGGDYYEDKKNSDQAAKKKQIAQVRATYTKKYGASYSNYLSKQATIVKGMPLAFIREYINDFNRIGFYGWGDKQFILKLQEYKPTQRDMMQFGRTVTSYKLICGSEPIWSFLVLNSKVVSSTLLSKISYRSINMNSANEDF